MRLAHFHGCRIGERNVELPLTGRTVLEGCETDGAVAVTQTKGGGYAFRRVVKDTHGNACVVHLQRLCAVRWRGRH